MAYQKWKCPKCSGEMWDNRKRKKNAKQPDFKCKDESCDKAIWIDAKDGSGKAFMEAHHGNGSNGAQSYDEVQSRIERQHSQEMALRYFAILGKAPMRLEELSPAIDFFQRDIGNGVPASAHNESKPAAERQPAAETEAPESDEEFQL